jgi:hypothetical protein
VDRTSILAKKAILPIDNSTVNRLNDAKYNTRTVPISSSFNSETSKENDPAKLKY